MSFSDQFKGKVIAITGAAQGIGYTTALLLASRGASLSLADIQSSTLDEAKDSILSQYTSIKVFSQVVDVRSAEQVETWIKATVSHFGRLDGAANIAGIVPRSIGSDAGLMENTSPDEWDSCLGVNLTGVMHCMKYELRVIAEDSAIVNASSIAGLVGREKNGIYTATKHGVVGLTRSAAKEVALAALTTAAYASLGTPDKSCRLLAPVDVAGSLGFNYTDDCVPSTGRLSSYMIYVDFPDAEANDTTKSLYDVFFPDAIDWFETASYGKLQLEVDTALEGGFARMPQAADSYHFQRGMSGLELVTYVQDAIDAHFDQIGTIPVVDVLYVVATRRATSITYSPSMGYTFTDPSGSILANKTAAFGYDSYDYYGFKVLNHETGHALCLPDLYPLAGGETREYVGTWDMMGTIVGPSPDFFAWNKYRLGWIEEDEVDCVEDDGTTRHELTPVSSDEAGVKAVIIRHSDTRVLVAEARSNTGVDENARRSGVLVYSVDTEIQTGQGGIIVYDGNPNTGSSRYGTQGDVKSDAALSLEDGEQEIYVEDFDVKVKIMESDGPGFQIEVRKGEEAVEEDEDGLLLQTVAVKPAVVATRTQPEKQPLVT
ncbi:uncharacterized protein J7T54_003621 [Emericellopsis cladophorae]|uniref:Uncharacterized protein n=1 Tax=Emericellopsis cladophorae TaxID=2686198 RepID=A0A9P9Y460_9HYPO|nr:uncharacterized protein J7T54_003621 [Emericellopsis cladophorae]KAI6782609.1 hypothetical protein J7T54_003621 [Emericellopsis cladophorae]